MERKFQFAVDEFYHVYNRGNDKRIIFHDDKDYFRFFALLYLCNGINPVNLRDNFPKGLPFGYFDDFFNFNKGEPLVAIGAYCLMPNHFHILVYEIIEGGISKFMSKLLTAYSMYFNKKYNRTGNLFEGVFRAEHVDRDDYLQYLFAYIHLNPIKLIEPKWRETGIKDIAKTKKFLKNYKYSSYLDHMEEDRPETAILNKSSFPGYFENHKEFEDYVDSWLKFKE